MLKKFGLTLLLSSALIMGFSQLAMATNVANVDCNAWASAKYEKFTQEWRDEWEWCMCHKNGWCP